MSYTPDDLWHIFADLSQLYQEVMREGAKDPPAALAYLYGESSANEGGQFKYASKLRAEIGVAAHEGSPASPDSHSGGMSWFG